MTETVRDWRLETPFNGQADKPWQDLATLSAFYICF